MPLPAGLRLLALSHLANRDALDLAPDGVPAQFVDAAAHSDWVAKYHAANAARFGGPVALPGWVLADLYLLPSVVVMLADAHDAIAAAACLVPTLVPGTVMGVSLFSNMEGQGLGYAVKRLALTMMRARVQRGITQWDSRALRVHTRFGPLRVLGPAPAVHGLAARSFVYEVELGAPSPAAAQFVLPEDAPSLTATAEHLVVAPGLSPDGRVALAPAPPRPALATR
jgi:hypothetical protein